MSTDQLLTPRDFVQSGWDYQRDLGSQWVNYTRDYLADFEDIALQPMTFDIPVDLQVDYGTFTRPVAPALPDLPDVVVTMPTAPTLDTIAAPELAAVPEEPDFSGLVYVKPTAPNAPIPERPAGLDVVLDDIVVPDAPVVALPADPNLYPLNLPEIPDLTVPEFTAVRPTRDFSVPSQTFAWSPTSYDDSVIQSIKSRLSDMMINGLGLPAHIEAAIFDRGRAREDILSAKAQQEAAEAFGSRGLSNPGGLLARRLDEIRVTNRQAASTVNRDLTIRAADVEIESTRFALTQAIALEMALVQANTALNELTLRGAQATQQVAIDLVNLKIALHNADVEGFKADAAVFESRIRALQAEADVLKTRIEAQKVIGDVNESLVRAYGEKMRAVSVLTEIYRTNVEAARAKGELNVQKLEQVKVRLQAYGQDIDAWGKLQEAHRISVDAELGSVRAMEVLGNVYGRRIEAWRTRNAGYFDQGRFKLESQAQLLERFRAELQGVTVDAQTQVSQLDARVRSFGAAATLYTAEAQMAASESAAHDRTASLRVEAARLKVGAYGDSLKMSADYAMKGIDAQIETVKAKAGIVSQLAASSQSGVNFGASYSGSLGVGYSYGRSYGYSGDTDDNNPNF